MPHIVPVCLAVKLLQHEAKSVGMREKKEMDPERGFESHDSLKALTCFGQSALSVVQLLLQSVGAGKYITYGQLDLFN